MKTSVEKLEGNVVRLTVALEPAEVDEAIEKTYKEYSGRIKVPGFRPGKAPKPVVDSYLGHDVVMAEATDNLVQDTYPKAVDVEGLRPIEQPKVEDLTPVAPGEAYEWVAEVQVRPELTLSSTDGITVTVVSDQVTDADVDAQIEQLQGRYASLGPVEDRGVEGTDFALISFVGYVDGEEYEGNRVDKYLYQMGMGSMPVEFDEQLTGTRVGGEAHIEFTIPESSSVAEFVGKTASFDVTVHEIKTQVMPEVNDEFAMTVGGFDTLDELKDTLRERIAREKAVQHVQAKERGVRQALAERLEGEIPQSMVDTRTESMTRDFVNGLESRGLSIEQYLEMAGISDEVIVNDMKRQAEQSVREDLALEALFRQQGMEVTDDDIEEELDLVASATKQDKDAARVQWEEMGLMPVIREQVQHRKAVNWLLDNATFEIVEPGGAEGEKAEAEKPAAKKSRSKAASKKAAEPEADADAPAPEADAAEPAADEPQESEE